MYQYFTFKFLKFKSQAQTITGVFILWHVLSEQWQVNEKGQNGGYTKVKCEMQLTGQEKEVFRVDITDRVNNGDFNPSVEHIANYIKEMFQEEEPEQSSPPAQQNNVFSLFNYTPSVN